MNEKMRESLSALLDGEANELETERVLARLAGDPELRQVWVRYNMVRSAVAGQFPTHPQLDISAQVRAATVERVSGQPRLHQRLLRPLASVAVAASVAAAVVFGGQQLAQLQTDSGGGQAIAVSNFPVGLVNSLGATSVQASYGTRQVMPVLEPAARTAYQKLARQKLEKYIQEHAEHAALNSPGGLVPFARVPHIQE